MDWLKAAARRDDNHLSFGILCLILEILRLIWSKTCTWIVRIHDVSNPEIIVRCCCPDANQQSQAMYVDNHFRDCIFLAPRHKTCPDYAVGEKETNVKSNAYYDREFWVKTSLNRHNYGVKSTSRKNWINIAQFWFNIMYLKMLSSKWRQAITRGNVDQYPCSQMASLGHNESTRWIPKQIRNRIVWLFQYQYQYGNLFGNGI